MTKGKKNESMNKKWILLLAFIFVAINYASASLDSQITFQGKLIGVINVQYKKPKKHSKEQIRLLSTIAKQVGGALENARLVGESNALKDALEVRKLVDMAKGILIKRDGLTEPDAYSHLQKLSMKHRKTMKEIAEAIIISMKP